MSDHTRIRRQQGRGNSASVPAQSFNSVTSAFRPEESLSSEQMLQLQRTIGNQAVMRMIARDPRSTAAPAPQSIQRKFKFERVEYTTEEAGRELAQDLYERWDLAAEEPFTVEQFMDTVGALAKQKKNLKTLELRDLVAETRKALGIMDDVKEITWEHTGSMARISDKALISMPMNCDIDNLLTALETRHEGNVNGWNLIKKMTNSNEYELKLTGSGDQRCYGLLNGQSGLVEFTRPFEKGKGK